MAYEYLSDEWSSIKPFFPAGGTINSIAVSQTKDSLLVKRSWKLMAAYWAVGVLMGPALTVVAALTVVVGQELFSNGFNKSVQQAGLFWASVIVVGLFGGWFMICFVLHSRKSMRIDTVAELIKLESRFFRTHHRSIAFSNICDVDLGTLIRRKDTSASITPDNLQTEYALDLILNSGEKIRVFETPNKEVSKVAFVAIEEALENSKIRLAHGE